MTEWMELIKTFGPSVAFMAFTVWRDWQREDRMSKALDAQQKELTVLNTRGISAIEQNTAANNNLTRAIERLPCRPVEEIGRKTGGFRTVNQEA